MRRIASIVFSTLASCATTAPRPVDVVAERTTLRRAWVEAYNRQYQESRAGMCAIERPGSTPEVELPAHAQRGRR